ncbi:MAG: hypothetical protein NC300_09730 [Bacteroidales bacterium]|nr:hypothetical protein [Clostridium sp.]MCM1204411.1 hypothetical protein [Bacteroidales bacterium]
MSMILQQNQKYIYVLLSRTHTVPARLIRLYTGEPYSHTSIALDVELNDMYSFARKHVYNPFDCGFIDENIETGIFGKDKNIYCSVYAVPVTEEQYQIIKQEIDVFIKNRGEYKYNYSGLFSIMFGRNVEDGKHFFCSQFVSHIFYKSGIKLFAKEDGLIRPYDFHVRLKDKRIYKGKLSEYRQFLRSHEVEYAESGQEEFAKAI